jgi:hypothetical protein
MSECHICGRETQSKQTPRGHYPPQCTCHEALSRAEDLLRRLSAWDMMDIAADGPFWREQIAETLTLMRE